MKLFGDGFVKLIKMVIVLIIFCIVVIGIVGMQSMKLVGKIGGMVLLYFEVVFIVVLIIGLVVVNVVQLGVGMYVDLNIFDISKIVVYVVVGEKQSIVDFLMNVIFGIVVGVFVNGDIFQVLFFFVFFGYVLYCLGSYGKLVFEFIECVFYVMFNIINVIMKVVLIGVFGVMVFIIGVYGVGLLVQFGQLMLCFYIICILFVFIVFGGIVCVYGFSILCFIKYICEELLIVLGILFFELVLLWMIDKMEKFGCNKLVVGLVIFIGYFFNFDGILIYLIMVVVFIVQVIDMLMDIIYQIILLLVLLIVFKGVVGVIGSGFIVFVVIFFVVGYLLVVGLVLIFGIDCFMFEVCVLINLVGNGVVMVVVFKWCKQFDEGILQCELVGEGNVLLFVSDILVGGCEVV